MLSFFKEFVHFILVVARGRHEIIHISFILNTRLCVVSLLFPDQFCYDLTHFINLFKEQIFAFLTCHIVSLLFHCFLISVMNVTCTLRKNVYSTVVDRRLL